MRLCLCICTCFFRLSKHEELKFCTWHLFHCNTEHVCYLLLVFLLGILFSDVTIQRLIFFSNFPPLKTSSSSLDSLHHTSFQTQQTGLESSTVMLIFFFTLWKPHTAWKTSSLPWIKPPFKAAGNKERRGEERGGGGLAAVTDSTWVNDEFVTEREKKRPWENKSGKEERGKWERDKETQRRREAPECHKNRNRLT